MDRTTKAAILGVAAALLAACSSSHPRTNPTAPPDESGARACDAYAHAHNLVYGGGLSGFRELEDIKASAAKKHLADKIANIAGLPGSTLLTSCDLFDRTQPQGPPAKTVWLDKKGRTYEDFLDSYLVHVTPSPGGT